MIPARDRTKRLAGQITASLLEEYESFFELDIVHRKKVGAAIALFYVAYATLSLIAFYPLLQPAGFTFFILVATFAITGALVDVALVIRPDLRRYYGVAIAILMVPAILFGLYLGGSAGAARAELFRPEIDTTETLLRGGGWLLTSLAMILGFRLYNRAARALHTGKARAEEEIRLAQRVQAELLPGFDRTIAGIEMFGISRPTLEAGGDYCDLIDMPGVGFALAIGDVSGHNLAAGVVVALTKAALMTETKHSTSAGAITESLNDTIFRTTERKMFVTLCCAIVDTEQHELTVANAGHLPLIHIRAADGSVAKINPKGIGLGLVRSADYQEERIGFLPGDLFILVTDGLTEMTGSNGEELGLDRVVEHARSVMPEASAREIGMRILAAVEEFAQRGRRFGAR